MDNRTCWVIAGPTASGKTSLSIHLAKEYNCEIVCMDSMQIYRRMNIGTAKPSIAEMDGIPHHMIDVAEPDEPFSVARYQEMAEDCIARIHERGKRALLVGGTGLYLRALRNPMAMGDVAGNEELRTELEHIATADGGKQQLHDMLEAVDPDTAARLHLNDVRRTVRALEVFRLTGVPFSKQPQAQESSRFSYRVASLTMDRDILYARIEKRVDMMVEQGLVNEVKELLDSGILEDCQAMKAIGYKEIVPFLHGKTSWEETDYLLKLNTRHYAKRQLTWMRHEEGVCWIDSLQPDACARLEKWFTQGEIS